MKIANRDQGIRTSRKRRLLQCGTALPLLLAWPALAAPIVEMEAGDIAVDTDSATGAPTAVDLRSSGGTVTANVDTVTADATTGQRTAVINLETADGAIDASFGTVTLTGDGQMIGVRANSQGGDIDIHVGEMALDGAITSGVQAHSVSGDVTVSGDNVVVHGTGADVAGNLFPEALYAWSEQGAATVVAGHTETYGLYGTAAVAVAGTDASVTVDSAVSHSDGAVTVYASGDRSATVDAGTVSMLGDGAAIQAFSNEGTVTVTADAVDSLGGGVFGNGANGVSLTAGTVDAVDYGLSGRSDTGGAVNLTVDSVTVSGGQTIAVLARTTGDVTIDAANVSVTGPGEFPGVRPDGYRYDQGGIVVLGEGGEGTIAINAGTVDVDGQERYGITARGNGDITINAENVSLESADSVAVVARGGEGDVSITTGTVTTTGASGVGVFANTTSGDIVVNAGTTRVENTGFVGDFTGDAVIATSETGTVSVTSSDAFSAALYGTAVAGISAGDVTIVSDVATTTGDGGAAVYGQSTNGNLVISANSITLSGNDAGALNAYSVNGTIDLDVGTISATGANSLGIQARVGTATANIDVGDISTAGSAIVFRRDASSTNISTINVAGDVVSSGARAIALQTRSTTPVPTTMVTTINIANGASVSGVSGIGLVGTINAGTPVAAAARIGTVTVNNAGTITGTGGTALSLELANGLVFNSGTINGNVNVGGGMVQNRGGTINGNVTLNTLAGSPLSIFGYEGTSTGVTGTITGSSAIDTFAQIFTSDGTATIGGGLPTAFDRYGVITDNAQTTVVVETAANPVGATPSLLLLGEGKIVNRANLSGTVVLPASPGLPVQVVPALYSYGFAPVQSPFGTVFKFEGAGVGPASVTNEASITGRIALTTSEFVNRGTIERNSAGVPSAITARNGAAFSFSNTGTISMVDGGARTRTITNNNPFTDFNPYNLPETALTIRSAIEGSLDEAGLYVPASISNAGLIDGGLLVRMTASTFAFDNSGRIEGFNGSAYSTQGLLIGLGHNWDASFGGQFDFEPPATLATQLATINNSGEITDGAELYLIADKVEFTNSGNITGNANLPDALYLEQYFEQDDADTTSFSFVNTGELDGNVGLNLEATTASITNSGSVIGHEYVPGPTTFQEILWGGETAFEIESETYGDGTLSFVNTGSIVNTGHGGSGVFIEVEAGDGDPDFGEPAVANAHVSVVNSGTISATGGATIVTPQFATWLQPGQFLANPIAALGVDATDVNGDSLVTIENKAGGVIEAGGQVNVATPNGYSTVTTSPNGGLAVAVYASGRNIEITNAGTIRGGAGTTVSPNAVFDGVDLYDDYLAGAIQTAGDEYGEDEVYVASIDHLTNTVTGTIIGSVDLGGNDDTIDNAGTITGNVFLRSGNDHVINRGTIDGLLDLGSGDDVLELTEGSIISAPVDLGEGNDTVLLSGGPGALGHVAATINAETLNVASGTWRADAAQSDYGFVTIGAGGHLIVGQTDDQESTITTSHVALAGRLDIDFAQDSAPDALSDVVIDGAGSLHLTGEGTLTIGNAAGLQYTGGTFVDNGELLLTTAFGGDITTSGDGAFTLTAGGDFTGNLVNNGVFRFEREDDYSFLGDFSGTGLLEKFGAGTLSFDGLYGFVGTTSIFGGHVIFTGQLTEDTELDLSSGVVDLSNIQSGQQTIAQLSGTGGALSLGQTNLVIEQTANTVYSGEVSGSGALVKSGEGDLKLNGDGSSFTGTGQVESGTLSVNGNFSHATFMVAPGGTLGGNGTVGQTTVNGGTLAPGNSIDTLNVNGDVTFTAASVFAVEVNAAGAADRVNASGRAILGGAKVNVIAANGTYRPFTDYTILTAAGGVSGTFSSVTDNLAFLDPSLIYSANSVTLRLVRNDIDFGAFGTTPGQAAIGNLIESFGYGNTLYNETLLLADSSVAPSFASLTGEVYPAYSAATFEVAEMLRRQVTGQMAAEGTYAWATGLYHDVDGGSGVGGIDLDGKGVAGGLGFGANGFSVAAGLGYLDQGKGGSQFSDGSVTFAIAQVAYDSPVGFSVSAGAQFGWVDGETRRQTTLGAINQAVTGEIDGDYVQLFGEVAYSVSLGGMAVEPFAGVSHVSANFDSVTETGAATALDVGAIDRDVTFADVGIRLSGDAGGVRPFASAAYRTAWGDRASVASVGFVGTTGSALIGAVPVAKSAAELSAGLAVTSGQLDFEVSYDGTVSKQFDSHAISAGLKFHF